MNGVIYRETIRPFNGRLDIDGAPFCEVTRENNGYAVWSHDDHVGTQMIRFCHGAGAREDAIRFAIEFIDTAREQAKGESA